MAIVKVLKRKDASSVIVAVVIAMMLAQALTTLTMGLATKLSGLDDGASFGGTLAEDSWKVSYLLPVVTVLLQLAALELVVWLYSAAKDTFTTKK